MADNIGLIAFLGNPGRQYQRNRHNVGMLFCDAIPEFSRLTWKSGFKGVWSSFDTQSTKIYCIKPGTFMNLSGESVREIAQYFHIPKESILVVHDELELAFGTIGLKFGGGLGGHNGLRSMNQCFQGPDFWRLRFGIGRPDHSDVAAYVLSNFSEEESRLLAEKVFPGAIPLIAPILRGDAPVCDKTTAKVKTL